MTNIAVRDMYKRFFFHVFAIHVSVEVVEQDDITIHWQGNGRC